MKRAGVSVRRPSCKAVIAPGETVVTDGHLRLFPGARIRQSIRKSSEEVSHEPLAHFHRASGHDGARVLRDSAVRRRRVPRAAGRRAPSVDYPTIQVQAALPGANPETMASTVATPLEREFSTIAGIESMTSTNSQGSTSNHCPVRARSRYRCRRAGHPVRDLEGRRAAAAHAAAAVVSEGESGRAAGPVSGAAIVDAAAVHGQRVRRTMLAQRISMVSGVSRVQVFGAQKYAVRVQVDPGALAARNIGIDEVQRAIQTSNTNLPTGRLDGDKQAFTIQSTGTLPNAAAYRPMIVAWRNGSPVRLEQLAHVIDSVENNKVDRLVQRQARGHPGDSTPARHATRCRSWTASSRCCRSSAARFRRRSISTSRSTPRESIRGSIHDVEFTLVLTIALVVMVIFLFLRNLSATIIPGLAVPFSIIGTFAVMYLLGYSLNNLSLMALTLSVGFVVDDAIVMLENIVRHMEMGKSRMEAAMIALEGDRLHDHLDDDLAGGRVHPRAVHGRHRRPAAARVLGHDRGRDSDLRLRFADPDADARQPLPADRATRRSTASSTTCSEAGFEVMTRAYERTLRHRDALPCRHVCRRGR